MKRNKSIKCRLNTYEFNALNDNVFRSGLSREAYLRLLIKGNIPQEKPSIDFVEMISQLRRIGNNLSQIALIAHKTGSIDVIRYKKDIEELNNNILEIREKILLPKEIHSGND